MNTPSALASSTDLKRLICDQTVAVCSRRFGQRLEAIVLTGSLARGEATVQQSGGGLQLLGDADYLLATRGPAEPSTEEIDAAAAEIEKGLVEAGIVAHVSLSLASPGFLEHLPPHSFTYELKTCGEVVWGDAAVLNRIPLYDKQQLSREDAWRTLNHRMIELLIAAVPGESSDRDTDSLTYATIKLYLDMATSYLIFAGRYEPSYAARAQALRNLAGQRSAESPLALDSFSLQVTQCTARKLNGYVPGKNELHALMEASAGDAWRLWQWEAARLGSVSESEPIWSLIRAVGHRQTLYERIHGWLSLLKRCAVDQALRNAGRWTRMSVIATPRYFIYGVAAQLFRFLPRLVNHDPPPPELRRELQGLRSRLPLAAESRAGDAEWQHLVHEIQTNYKACISNTTA